MAFNDEIQAYRKAIEQEFNISVAEEEGTLDQAINLAKLGSFDAMQTLVYIQKHGAKDSDRIKAATFLLEYVSKAKTTDPLQTLLEKLQADPDAGKLPDRT